LTWLHLSPFNSLVSDLVMANVFGVTFDLRYRSRFRMLNYSINYKGVGHSWGNNSPHS
ncbi:hypothetical protein L9F63_004820, partial [Diploptera punctata]